MTTIMTKDSPVKHRRLNKEINDENLHFARLPPSRTPSASKGPKPHGNQYKSSNIASLSLSASSKHEKIQQHDQRQHQKKSKKRSFSSTFFTVIVAAQICFALFIWKSGTSSTIQDDTSKRRQQMIRKSSSSSTTEEDKEETHYNDGDLDDIFKTIQQRELIVEPPSSSDKAWWKQSEIVDIQRYTKIWKSKQPSTWCSEEWVPHNNVWTEEQYMESVPKSGQEHHGLIFVRSLETYESTLEGITLNIAYNVGKRQFDNQWKKCIAYTQEEYSSQKRFIDGIKAQSLMFSFIRHPQTRDMSHAFTNFNINGEESEINVDPKGLIDYMERSFKGYQTKTLLGERNPDERIWQQMDFKTQIQSIPGAVSTYDFLGVSERMDESLAAMVLLWDLEPADVIVLSEEKYCNEVSKATSMSKLPAIHQYFEGGHHSEDNPDYLLYHAANFSLTKTIESLGKDRVGEMTQQIRHLQKEAEKTCQPVANFCCSSKAEQKVESMEEATTASRCYYKHSGCANECIANAIAPKVIRELKQVNNKFYIYDDDIIYQKFLMKKLRQFQSKSLQVENDNNNDDNQSLASITNVIETENKIWDALWNHPLRTSNVKEAELFLIPTPVTELIAHGCVESGCIWFDEAFRALSKHPIFRNTNGGNSHVLLSFHPKAFNLRYAAKIPALARAYPILENVTVVSDYDPFGCTKLPQEDTTNIKGLFSQELPVSKAFSVGMYGDSISIPITRANFKRYQQSVHFIFYRTSRREFAYDTTQLRRAVLNKEVLETIPHQNLAYYDDESNDVTKPWAEAATKSQYCLVIREGTPHTDALFRAIRAGCIPVIVSDCYQMYAGPFKTSLKLEDFSISVDEERFLSDPCKELLSLQDLKEDYIKAKLKNITLAQQVLFPDHDNSMFVEAFLKEAKHSGVRGLDGAFGRDRVLLGETSEGKQSSKSFKKDSAEGTVKRGEVDRSISKRFNRILKLAPENRGLINGLKSISTRFYVYEDPSVTQSFLLKKLRLLGDADIDKSIDHTAVDAKAEKDALDALLNHPLRSLDHNEAELFVIPTPITELIAHGCTEVDCSWFDEAFDALSRHPVFRKTSGNNHVLISFHWSTFNPRYGSVFPAISKSYKILENVTVAHHYDPFGCVALAEKTKADEGIGFNALFPQELPVTKAFSVGLGIGASFPVQSRNYKQFMESRFFLFYHTRETAFDYGSTPFRRAVLEEEVTGRLPPSSIGFGIDYNTWVKHFFQSKFALVVRGDTPHTHALLHAVRAACIPVIVSDFYEEYAGPFKSSLNLKDFSIVLDETDFLSDPAGELLALLDLDKDYIASKLRNLTIVQSMVFPDHPESLFVEALLKEAAVADQKSVASTLGRPRVEVKEATVTISGREIAYRYSNIFSAPSVLEDADRVVVGVLSAAQSPTPRHMVRQTWAKLDPQNLFFVVAGRWEDIAEEFLNYGDLLWLDIEETYYYGLTYKTEVFLHATETHVVHYSYVFKTDDDSYIVLDKLSQVLHGHRPDFWGNCNKEEKWRHPERDPSHQHYMPVAIWPKKLYPVWASGLGYALSRNFNQCAIQHLADLPFMPMEDVSVGILAEKCKVECTQESWTWREGPDHTEYWIAHHHVKEAKQMENLHWQHHYDRKFVGGRAAVVPPLVGSTKAKKRAVEDLNNQLITWMEENSRTKDTIIADTAGNEENDIVIWIAKVVSKADVLESLIDVAEVTRRPFTNDQHLSVYWKFFFFDEEARLLMEAGLKNLNLMEDRVELVLEPKKMKPYYWSRYLDPAEIPREVDYIWLLDGDISLRHMAWECFWDIAHNQIKPSIFQPALLFLDPEREQSKTGWHQVVHPSSCQNDPTSTINSLVAIETGFVENQLPVFRREAWEIVYSEFAKLGDWGNFETSWGHDLVWCGIVEAALNRISIDDLLKNDEHFNDWRDVENSCQLGEGAKVDSSFSLSSTALVDQTLSDRPITCAVVHATPVVHLDTKAELDSKKGGRGHNDGERFRSVFPDAFYFSDCSIFDENYWFEIKEGEKIWLDRGQYRYWRSFTSETACQSCKSYQCLTALQQKDHLL